MRIDANSWYYSPNHAQLCQIIEAQTLWGETTCRVWLPRSHTVVRIPASRLKSLESAGTGSPDDIAYVAAAARVADALTQDILLAPIESSVIPLPHQIRALSRAITNDRVRYLLADEVGLGKTIEAGLIMRELKLRGLVKRTLVIAPKGLVSQWVSEMRFHFGETFQLVLPEDIKTLKRIAPATGPGKGEKANYAFAARRKTVERIGLPQVRNYRLNLLAQEERSFQEQLDQKAHAYPEMVPLLVIRVEGGS